MMKAAVTSSGSTAFALARGREALGRRDFADAIKWLDRARRLSPEDPRVDFHFASAQSLHNPLAAIEVLTDLVAIWPRYWTAKIALAALFSKVGENTKAAELLGNILQRSAVLTDDHFCRLASSIAKEAGYSGWVGIDSLGAIVIEAKESTEITILLDGKEITCGVSRDRNLTGIILPKAWRSGRHIEVTPSRGHRLLGSPLDVRSHIATEGFVEVDEHGKIKGWAWCPGNPSVNPVLRIMGGDKNEVICTIEACEPIEISTPLVEARGFGIMATDLPRDKILRVAGLDGVDLYGSPLFQFTLAVAQFNAASALGRVMRPTSKTPARSTLLKRDDWRPILAAYLTSATATRTYVPGRIPKRRDYDVVIPIYRGAEEFMACIRSVLAILHKGSRVIVVDDATQDANLRAALDALVDPDITIIRNASNCGFPASANRGIRAAYCYNGQKRDTILLNSDTILPRHGFQSMIDLAYSSNDIGSVTPMTNDGSLVSYMAKELSYASKTLCDTDGMNAAFCKANKGLCVDIPTAVGFCMFIRHDCLSQTGLFREDLFSQGYGEENDWSMRARQLGWRHVVDLATFVPHQGGRSFGAARLDLQRRNSVVLNQLHPGYDDVIRKFHASNALGPARLTVDKLRWRAGIEANGSVVLICHGLKGGVGRHVDERAVMIRKMGLRPIIVRPFRNQQGDSSQELKCSLSDGSDEPFPNLIFDIERDPASLASFLDPDRARWVEIHHILGHPSQILSLASAMQIPFDLYVHDYALVCPRITLSDEVGRYCGEPVDVRDCEACISDRGSRLTEVISVTALRNRTRGLAQDARKVIVPTNDTARRFGRYIDDPRSVVLPWQDDTILSRSVRPRSVVPADGKLRVCLVGGIGQEKGYDILLACARDAERRHLALEFIVIGYTIDDSRLIDTGCVHVTGKFDRSELGDLLRSNRLHIGFLPSITPETWCYALSEMWAAGLWVFAFSVGAQAERIAGVGAGTLLPLGMPAAEINQMLLNHIAN